MTRQEESHEEPHLANGRFDGSQPAFSRQGWRFELHGDLIFPHDLIQLRTPLGVVAFRLGQAHLEIVPSGCEMDQRDLGFDQIAFGDGRKEWQQSTQSHTKRADSLKTSTGVRFTPFGGAGRERADIGAGVNNERAKQETREVGGTLTCNASVADPLVRCLGISDRDNIARFEIKSPIPSEPLKGQVLRDPETDGRLGTVYGKPGQEWTLSVRLQPVIRLADIEFKRCKWEGALNAIFGKHKLRRHWNRDPKMNLALILLGTDKGSYQSMRFRPPDVAGWQEKP